MFGRPVRFLLFLPLLVLLAGVLDACSPAGLFGDAQDRAMMQAPLYRKSNAACAGMDLSNGTLDGATLVQIVDCLNGNGELKPLAALVHRLERTDRTRLDGLVTMLNRYVLGDSRLLFEFDSAYSDLQGSGKLDTLLREFGGLLDNKEAISSGIALLHESYSHLGPSRKRLLHALERLSSEVRPRTAAQGLHLAILIAQARAFPALQKHFRGPSRQGRDAEQLVAGLRAWLADRDPGHFQLIQKVLEELAGGRLYLAADEVFGTDEAAIRRGVPDVSKMLSVAFARGRKDNAGPGAADGAIMDGIVSLFHYLHSPMSCFQGAVSIPDADMAMLRELDERSIENPADFYDRANFLSLILSTASCSLPAEVGRSYTAMLRLSKTAAARPSAEVARALYHQGLAPEFIALLADTGAENNSGVKRIFPLLAELTEREVWDDFFYLFTGPGDRDREILRNALKFLTDPVIEDPAGSLSIYNVFSDAILEADTKHLWRFISSLSGYAESDTPVLLPALTAMRSAFYVDDAHPFVTLVGNVMASASENEKYFEMLFEIAEMEEFQDTLTLFSEMSKDNRLRELLGSLVSLFHRSALKGEHVVALTREPSLTIERRHDLTREDALWHLPPEAPWDMTDPCHRLALSTPFLDQNAEESRDYFRCLNRGETRRYDDVERGVDYLLSQRTPEGGDYYRLFIDMIRSLALDAGAQRDLMGRWMKAVDDGRFRHFLDAMPFWLSVPLRDNILHQEGSLAAAVVETAGVAISETPASVRRILDFAADAVGRRDFPEVLRFLRRPLGNGNDFRGDPGVPRLDPAVLSKAEDLIRGKELLVDPGAVAGRLAQLVDDFENAFSNGDLIAGKRRRSWRRDEFFGLADRLLTRLTDVRYNSGDKPITAGLVDFMRTLSPRPENSPQNLAGAHPSAASWLKQRSSDVVPILYYYPGESCPRVRLVNTLDRLELLVLNADFEFVTKRNFLYDFLGRIAVAWGDAPRSEWPPEIQHMFANKSPLTLREVSNDIDRVVRELVKWIGVPDEGDCRSGGAPQEGFPFPFSIKARVFNLAQVSSTIAENAPGSGHPNAGGLIALRNLVYELWISSPADHRKPGGGDLNNLSTIVQLSELGTLRQIGRMIRQSSDALTYPRLVDFLDAFTVGAQSEEGARILNSLLGPGADTLLVRRVLETLFDRIDGAGGGDSARRLRQGTFLAVTAAKKLDVIEPALRLAEAMIAEDRGYATLEIPEVVELLDSDEIVDWLRPVAGAGDGLQQPDGMRAFSLMLRDAIDPRKPDNVGLDAFRVIKACDRPARILKHRWDFLQSEKTYGSLDMAGLGRDLLDFFEEDGADAGRTSRAFRQFIAGLLGSRARGASGSSSPGDIEQWMLLAKESINECQRSHGGPCRGDDALSGALAAFGRHAPDLSEAAGYMRRALVLVPANR